MSPLSIVICILGLGVLAAVHEIGHFIVARLLKIKVYELSIFVGPKLFSWKRKDIDLVDNICIAVTRYVTGLERVLLMMVSVIRKSSMELKVTDVFKCHLQYLTVNINVYSVGEILRLPRHHGIVMTMMTQRRLLRTA